MKYLLSMYMNPTIWESLSEEEQSAVFQGHDEFQKTIIASGEMVGTKAIGDPSQTTVVRVRDGAAKVAEGPYVPGEEFFCGYYVVDCATRERADELAALIPDARHTAVEVRPIVFEAGPEL
ncbi:YciI family protein [Microbispora sp. ATCC PTA-5024]|uniref:YciI family protein n=1 Tax=Microbispora sp. ATCC PTA-5024 TaxID=316330 RepID=UPI0003DDD0C3|nr:YciI family protein [Microbispora sp. ATCC PTA-5024]ETK37182.1 hypothetical protein MPTA5024_05270 [Microbispora sp. ATCC PTA-5024]